ncbi:MAG TPA: methyltransferase domain-containing protein [Acidimicrobiales bacterium]|jgi:ubiquinone/menaquinone biosynthesis C-methylase UbiE|nr:methyltransferase domain-containing protein [Acidimicrobiales bacterium]
MEFDLPGFDLAATFGDDYLYFYEESIDDQHSDDDAADILGRLGLPAGARILDAPCGHGRIARRLAAAGMDVTGVDLSAPYLQLAREQANGPTGRQAYVRGDLRQLPVDGPFEVAFDAVVCWYTSFGYYDDADCRRVLQEFRRVLRPGGQLLIDTMHHDGAVRHFTATPDATVVIRGDDAQIDRNHFDPLTGRMVTERTVHRDGEVRRSAHFIRLPTPPEWLHWLEEAGFSDVGFTAGGGGPLELDSWVMVVHATA